MRENFIRNVLRNKTIFVVLTSLIFIIKKVLCEDLLITTLDIPLSHAITLYNKNLFIIYQKGVLVYDPTITTKVSEYNFEEDKQILDISDDKATSYLQVPVEERPIFLFTKKRFFYVFKSDGTFIFYQDLLEDYILDEIAEDLYFSFIFQKYDSDELYYYCLISYTQDNKIKLAQLTIDIDGEFIDLNDESEDEVQSNSGESVTLTKGTTCQVMEFWCDDYFYCFFKYVTDEGNTEMRGKYAWVDGLGDESFTSVSSQNNYEQTYIKSAILVEKQIVLICYASDTDNSGHCLKYDSSLNRYYEEKEDIENCDLTSPNGFNVYYFSQTKEYIISCTQKDSNDVKLVRYTENMEKITETNIPIGDSTNSVKSFSVFYSVYNNRYCIIGDTEETSKTEIHTTSKDFNENITYDKDSEDPNIIVPDKPDTDTDTIQEEMEETYEIEEAEENIEEKEMEEKYEIEEMEENTEKEETEENIEYVETEEEYEIEENSKKEKESESSRDQSCPIKCKTCNIESIILSLCKSCNYEDKYYPVNDELTDKYFNCYNNNTKPKNCFFNSKFKYYERCYTKCASCDYQGNNRQHNCTSCIKNYILNPLNNGNCIFKCENSFYLEYGQYKCTESKICPSETNIYIKEKDQCVSDCSEDSEYKYLFNSECQIECPEGTSANEGTYICKLTDPSKCSVYNITNNFNVSDITNDTENEKLIKNYANEFNYTENHIVYYVNDNSYITIFQNSECINELSLNTSVINFKSCYDKLLKSLNNPDLNYLITEIIDVCEDNKTPKTSFNFYNPYTGEKLSLDECQDEKYNAEKSLYTYSGDNLNLSNVIYFGNQQINIFDITDDFYTDICYRFTSPNEKDVPIKDRILLYFPNITLCEEDCEIKRVNLTTMRADCECKFDKLKNNEYLNNDITNFDEVISIVEQTNLKVLKCIKYIFILKYFLTGYGGLITLLLLAIHFASTIIFIKKEAPKLKARVLHLLNSYLTYLSKNKNAPPKRKTITEFRKISNNERDVNDIILTNSKASIKKMNTYKNIESTSRNIFTKKTKNNDKSNHENSKKKMDKELKEYMKDSYGELDYEEALEKDKRKLSIVILDYVKENMEIVNIIVKDEIIIPRLMKFTLLLIHFDLYFLINGLFFNEEYISQLFYSEKKEKFFSFFPRSLNRIVYTIIICWVMDMGLNLFFPMPNKIKKILNGKQKDRYNLSKKISSAIKRINTDYKIFLIASFVITIFSWLYTSCFNYVYPYTKNEWIKSSITIAFIMQMIQGILGIALGLFRFISLNFKSEKLYIFLKKFERF